MALLSLLVPEATRNYIKNPSFRFNITGWASTIGSGQIVFNDTFDRADGALGAPWTAPNAAIVSNEVVITPTMVELITNGSMEAGNPPNNWAAANAVLTGVADERPGGSGSQALNCATTAAFGGATQATVVAADTWILIDAWRYVFAGGGAAYLNIAGFADVGFTGAGAWDQFVDTQFLTVANPTLGLRHTLNGADARFDDISIKSIDFSTALATVQQAGDNADIEVDVDYGANVHPAGIIAYLDDAAAPQNFIILYLDGTNLLLDKVVAGTKSNVLTVADATTDSRLRLEGRLDGSDLKIKVYVDGVQSGAEQTVSDAGIVGNTIHGMFSLSSENTLDNFSLITSTVSEETATLSRTIEEARFGVSSLKVITDGIAVTEGAYIIIDNLSGINDILTASVYLRGDGKVRLRLTDEVNALTWTSDPVSLTEERWTRVEVTGRNRGGANNRLYVETVFDSPAVATYYIDGVQLERKPTATTYCDGDQPGCRWNIEFHNSESSRDGDTREGGRWVDLVEDCVENDLYFTSMGGMGMPPIRNNIQPWSNSPGSFHQNEKVEDRVITLAFHAKNKDFRHQTEHNIIKLHELRQQLLDLIKPDKTPDSQPFWIRYSSDKISIMIKCHYEGGLEGDWDIRNRWIDSFPMRLLCVDPLFVEDSRDVYELNFIDSQKAGDNLLWVREDGEWTSYEVGVTDTALITAFAFGVDGRLYIAGSFEFTPGVTEGAAVFDGETVQALGDGFDNQSTDVAVGPDGKVYYVGGFTTAGGNPALRVAMWDPDTETWSALGAGLNGSANAVEVAFNGDVYVGGGFTTAGGVAANRIARWDGALWNAVGAGLGSTVYALRNSLDGSRIYVGGQFQPNPGRIASIIVDTGALDTSGIGYLTGTRINDGIVYTLDIGKDGSLYAAGTFTEDDLSRDVRRIAKFVSDIWNELDSGVDASVFKIFVDEQERVYGVGTFDENNAGTKDLPATLVYSKDEFNALDILQITSENSRAVIKDSAGRLYLGGYLDQFYEFSKTTTVNNAGTTSVFPVIYIKGPGRLRQIENVTTQKILYFDLTLQEDEEVFIDVANATIKNSIGNQLFGSLSDASDFRSFFLVPGNNIISAFMLDDIDGEMQIGFDLYHWSVDAVSDPEDL